MPKWVAEGVLQKYFVENHTKYSYKSQKIVSARFNQPFDSYPDVFCVLEDKKEVPAEVEWKTSDFNHDIEILRRTNGFIIVYRKDQNFELDQIEIDKDDFRKWYVSNADKILLESIVDIEEEIKERSFPELWFYYLDKNSYRHFLEFSLGYSEKEALWGVPGIVKEFRQLNRFRQIREGDLILFMNGWKTKGQGGRVPFKKFKGELERANLYRITTDYYHDESKVSDEIKGWEGETYPHRFQFDKRPIIQLNGIPIRKLSFTTRSELHKLFTGSLFWNGHAASLLDMISHGDH
jgi:hypothetical protein